MHWHIILTEKCNSECRYCYHKSMQEFDNELDKKWEFDFSSPCDSEVNIQALKKFILQDENPSIVFYGGEPLLQIEKIKQIINEFKDKAKYFMQTNGKLLNNLPKEYMNRFSKILVSLDGNEQRTDFNRGKGTYEKVMENLNLIRKNGFKGEIVARMTISEFPDILEQVKNLLTIKEIDSIHWQLDMGFYKFDFNKEKHSQFVEEYNQSITKLLNFWIENMKSGKVLKLYPFLGIFENLYYNTKTKLRCGAGYAGFAITTKGDIVPCPIMNSIKTFHLGNLNSKISNLKEISVEPPCTECNYLNLCGGRCLYSNKAKLWPQEGEKLICKTIKHLIDSIKNRMPEIKQLIQNKTIKESDFEYEKYFGPEIIP